MLLATCGLLLMLRGRVFLPGICLMLFVRRRLLLMSRFTCSLILMMLRLQLFTVALLVLLLIRLLLPLIVLAQPLLFLFMRLPLRLACRCSTACCWFC